MNVYKLAKASLLLVSVLGVALISCSNSDDAATDDHTKVILPPATADVQILETNNQRSYDLRPTSCAFATGDNLSPHTVMIDDSQTFQTMDGFGAAITGSTAFNLMQMKPADRQAFLQETFSPTQGYGFSYVRVAIGCSDFSFSEYTCCDTEGIEHFALTAEETEYVIPILKEILAINPDLRIMAAPWTCPKWMKVNNLTDLVAYDSWTGGELNPAYYTDYATYFVKWLDAFKAQGIHVTAITPQNEPLNRGNSASLYMGWEQQAAFIEVLGPVMRAAGLGDVKIYAYDHNYNYDNIEDQQGYPMKIYDTPASEYITGAAYHNYGGQVSEMGAVHAAYPNKGLLFTETSIGTWNSGRDLSTRLIADMTDTGLRTIENWSTGVLVWNLVLDNDRGPNREGGCQTCYGAVDLSNYDYKTITRNSHYYVIAHLAAFVKPDAVRIACTGYTPENVLMQAFKNTDGSYALVVCNTSDENKSITFSDGKNYFMYTVGMKSVVSFKWNK